MTTLTRWLLAWLAAQPPVLRRNPLDDHVDVLDGCAARLMQRIRERLDHLRDRLLGHTSVVELDFDYRHVILLSSRAILRRRAWRHLVDGPRLAAEAPVLGRVALDDDP